MRQRDAAPGGRRVGQVVANRIIHAPRAALFELQDRGGRHLLGDRSHAEPGRGGVRHPPLEVGEFVGAVEQNLVAAGDEHGAHELPPLHIRLDDGVEAGGAVRRGGQRGEREEARGNRYPADHWDARSRVSVWCSPACT